MKKILFLLFSFLMIGSWALAQPYDIAISGMVTDANGAGVPNVEIIIATDSFPFFYRLISTRYTPMPTGDLPMLLSGNCPMGW